MKDHITFPFLLLTVMATLSGCAATRPTSITTPPNTCPDRPTPVATCPDVALQPSVKKKYINSIGMEFVFIPPGCFVMGSNDGRADEKPLHAVQITKGFWMQTTEVTQEQWSMIMGNNPSDLRGKSLPVEKVSWLDAMEFTSKLMVKEKQRIYRLPTEAEWEYACRGGKASETYCGGNDSDAVAWHEGNARDQTHPVASKRPNGFGLYDMSGNVWEWVSDRYHMCYYGNSPYDNPLGPDENFLLGDPDQPIFVQRGGGWSWPAENARAALRYVGRPNDRHGYIGFRLISLLPGQ